MSTAQGFNQMRFSFKLEGRVKYGDVIGTIALLLTVIGLLL